MAITYRFGDTTYIYDLDNGGSDIGASSRLVGTLSEVADLIPGFGEASVTVNGRKCRNPFHDGNHEIFEHIKRLFQQTAFHPIHGDPTFSNSLIDKRMKVWLPGLSLVGLG